MSYIDTMVRREDYLGEYLLEECNKAWRNKKYYNQWVVG